MTIERMDAQFECLKWDQDVMIPRDFLRAAMRSSDLEVLGTAYQFLTDARNAARVAPPIPPAEFVAFANLYLGRCLIEDHTAVDFLAQRSLTRNGAGWEIVRWYVRLLKDAPDGEYLASIRARLAAIYRNGDEFVRSGVVVSTMSHLFASAAVRRTFSEWKHDPVLRVAYARAMPKRSPQTGRSMSRGAVANASVATR
jgi:hypothetical protein